LTLAEIGLWASYTSRFLSREIVPKLSHLRTLCGRSVHLAGDRHRTHVLHSSGHVGSVLECAREVRAVHWPKLAAIKRTRPAATLHANVRAFPLRMIIGHGV
jgi:hypothetical protein